MARSIAEFRRYLGARAAHYTEAQLRKALDAASFERVVPAAASMEGAKLLDLPDVRQRNDFECGMSSTLSVLKYFGVGEHNPDKLSDILGTNVKTSTSPQAIIDYLSSVGLQVEPRQHMTIDDLRQCWHEGRPVICCIQEYGLPSKQASYDYGHWVVVLGAALGQVFVQDPSIDNVLEGEDADQTSGRMMIDEKTWMQNWHDQDADGNKFEQFGIAVGPPAGGFNRIAHLTKAHTNGHGDSTERAREKGLITRDDFGYAAPPDGTTVANFAQCGACWKFTGQSCLEFRRDIRVSEGGACDFYSLGEPIGQQGVGHESGGTTPEAAGYVERDVRCENCGRANETATKCLFYEELNQKDRKRFALDTVVQPTACCNAQTPKEKQTVEKRLPIDRALRARIQDAASETDREPTEGQRESGNYRKGRVSIHGLTIAIENPRGSKRRGIGEGGKPWSVTMAHHYGYVARTESEADGDPVDVFIGPDPESEIVYVVNQLDKDGSFDEHKAMLGFLSEEQARKGYLDCYTRGWKCGEITPMTIPQFKEWIKSGDTSKPLPGQRVNLGHAPVVEKALWESSKHPRGQPENKGEFASSGGQQQGQVQPNNGMANATPGAVPPASPKSAKNPSADWHGRQETRDKAREQLDSADLEGHAMNAKVWNDFSAVDNAARQGKIENIEETLKGVTGEWAKHWDQAQAMLQAAGADDADLAKMTKLKERAVLSVVGKAKVYVEQLQKYRAAKAVESDLEAAEPKEPKTPDYPAEPRPEDYANDAEYERDLDAAQAETEKLEAHYDKAYEQWGKEHERWTAKSERAADKVDSEADRLDDRLEAVSDIMDQYRDVLAEHLSSMDEKVRRRLDSEDETDTEPEEPEESEESEEGYEPWLKKTWESSKHPRGGDPKNPGRFSHGAGTRPYPGPDAAYPSFPGAPGAKSPPTRNTGELRRPLPADYLHGSQQSPASSADRSPLHKSLEQSPVKKAKPLIEGVNQTALLTLADGTQAVFKPRRGEEKGIRKGVPDGTLYKREVAASRLADALGFGDLVPATTVRDQGGDIGSAQAFVPEAETPLASLQPFDGPEDAARAAVFDYILGHLDRHAKNWLLKDGKLALIDNGCSLPVKHVQGDFFNMKMWENADLHKLKVPLYMTELADQWPEAEKALRESGIEDEAIALAKDRFDAVTSGDYLYIKDLPSLIPEDQRDSEDTGDTLGSMARFYSREARIQRAREALEKRNKELEEEAAEYEQQEEADEQAVEDGLKEDEDWHLELWIDWAAEHGFDAVSAENAVAFDPENGIEVDPDFLRQADSRSDEPSWSDLRDDWQDYYKDAIQEELKRRLKKARG